MKLPALIANLFSGPARPGKAATRSLDAAGGGRRWADDRGPITAGGLHGQAAVIGARATHFAINTAVGARIVESLVANIVGDGIKPRSEHPEKATRVALQEAFKGWCDEADADGRRDFYGLQQDAARDMVTFGEYVFIILSEPQTGMPQLRRLHPDQLDRSLTRLTHDRAGTIIQGVEFDADGRVIAYHIRQSASNDPFMQLAAAPIRYPASMVLHGFRPLVPGQVRGISWLTPVLLTANDHDRLTDAIIMRSKVAAMHAGFIRDAQGAGSPYSGETTGPTEEVAFEPGALVHLPPGKDIEFATLPDQSGAVDLLRSIMRQIAAGAGVTYEMASGDYSQVNYSSERSAQLQFRRFASGVQFHQLVFPFCRPAWRRLVAYQAFRGIIPATRYAVAPKPYEAAKWLPPAWDWVDPEKDAKAAETEVRNHFKSRAEVIAERGYDIEDVDAEFAADSFTPPAAAPQGGLQ